MRDKNSPGYFIWPVGAGWYVFEVVPGWVLRGPALAGPFQTSTPAVKWAKQWHAEQKAAQTAERAKGGGG